MAKIKSFTDFSQSKTLSKILPLESADMSWVSNGLGKPFARTIPIKGDPEELCGCWSLSALLSVLPRIDIEKEICSDDTYDYRVKAYIGDGYIGDWYNNPVDACYELVLKLNELNLL